MIKRAGVTRLAECPRHVVTVGRHGRRRDGQAGVRPAKRLGPCSVGRSLELLVATSPDARHRLGEQSAGCSRCGPTQPLKFGNPPGFSQPMSCSAEEFESRDVRASDPLGLTLATPQGTTGALSLAGRGLAVSSAVHRGSRACAPAAVLHCKRVLIAGIQAVIKIMTESGGEIHRGVSDNCTRVA